MCTDEIIWCLSFALKWLMGKQAQELGYGWNKIDPGVDNCWNRVIRTGGFIVFFFNFCTFLKFPVTEKFQKFTGEWFKRNLATNYQEILTANIFDSNKNGSQTLYTHFTSFDFPTTLWGRGSSYFLDGNWMKLRLSPDLSEVSLLGWGRGIWV